MRLVALYTLVCILATSATALIAYSASKNFLTM